MGEVFGQIYEVVKKVPKGKVATYGQIARLAGNPKWSRVVGYALHSNPDPQTIHCYKVVNRFGKLSDAFAFNGPEAQKMLLEMDGVKVSEDYYVDLDKYQWKP